jgi:hypothetical protein
MPRAPRPPHLDRSSPVTAAVRLPELPLDPGVRLILEGSDQVAVEAAVAAVRAAFAGRFAVTDRRLTAQGATLRVTGSLRINPDEALDASAASYGEDQPRLPGF